MSDEIVKVLIERLLDWPVILGALACFVFVKYRTLLELWMTRVSEVKFGDLQFKIGKDEVPLERLDATITARLRELQEEIDGLKLVEQPTSISEVEYSTGKEIPEVLRERMTEQVYPMLKSNLWLGRYVKTLAKACSVTEETMLTFCRSRSDIGLFKDGAKWVAALKERLDNNPGN